jgi:hypothetical protein
MKKLPIIALLLLPIAGSSQVITFKKWQSSIAVAVGTNYNGMDYFVSYQNKIKNSPFGFYLMGTKGKENIKVKDADYKKDVDGIFGGAGLYISLYDFIMPTPINITAGVNVTYVNEKMKLNDGGEERHSGVGNGLDITIEYLLTKNFAIQLRQNLSLIYGSPFGKSRTSSGIGLNVYL